ncbi:hypothetical protein [Hyphococcus sp.]|uniref:hypothetical protein n=1 Tax=Hyphococcus sp. TaxID=2038636 RepID=UPI003CCC31AC
MTGTENDYAPSPGAEPSKFGSLAHSIGARNLILIIIAMPFFFLVAVMGVIAVFGAPQKAAGGETIAGETPAVSADALSYPAGAAPGAIALDGDRLAVRIDGPDGVTVIVYDLEKGEVIARVQLTAQAQAP